MRIGIGLPAAVPDADMATLGRWASEAEHAGFDSVGVIDRLVYDNLDPLTALAAAAASTSRVELMTTVLNVCWRGNATLLAKQLSSVDRLSAGRLTAGLGMGGWPADYAASGVPLTGRAALFEKELATMSQTWQEAGHRPKILLAGAAPKAFARTATPMSGGWVAPLFGLSLLKEGRAAVEKAWADSGRTDRPRIATGRYFCLGPNAEAAADGYIHHYYGPDYFAAARADTLTTEDQIRTALLELSEAGCTDVLLYPCTADPDQVALLAKALER